MTAPASRSGSNPSTMSDDPQFLSIQSAAVRGDLSVKMVRRLIASGDLPAKRVGQRFLRIRTADFDALLSA